MKKEGYYSSGQFAGMAHVTLRTIRYYDKQGILKSVDGTKPMDEVFSAIVGILGE